jgi:hypothetical protein
VSTNGILASVDEASLFILLASALQNFQNYATLARLTGSGQLDWARVVGRSCVHWSDETRRLVREAVINGQLSQHVFLTDLCTITMSRSRADYEDNLAHNLIIGIHELPNAHQMDDLSESDYEWHVEMFFSAMRQIEIIDPNGIWRHRIFSMRFSNRIAKRADLLAASPLHLYFGLELVDKYRQYWKVLLSAFVKYAQKNIQSEDAVAGMLFAISVLWRKRAHAKNKCQAALRQIREALVVSNFKLINLVDCISSPFWDDLYTTTFANSESPFSLKLGAYLARHDKHIFTISKSLRKIRHNVPLFRQLDIMNAALHENGKIIPSYTCSIIEQRLGFDLVNIPPQMLGNLRICLPEYQRVEYFRMWERMPQTKYRSDSSLKDLIRSSTSWQAFPPSTIGIYRKPTRDALLERLEKLLKKHKDLLNIVQHENRSIIKLSQSALSISGADDAEIAEIRQIIVLVLLGQLHLDTPYGLDRKWVRALYCKDGHDPITCAIGFRYSSNHPIKAIYGELRCRVNDQGLAL